MPLPEEKLAARSPVMERPAVTAAAACSPSGSMKMRGRPETLMWPLAVSSAQYSPICVEGVMGYAPAASVDSRSHMMTAVLPSIASRMPGNLKVLFIGFVSWFRGKSGSRESGVGSQQAGSRESGLEATRFLASWLPDFLASSPYPFLRPMAVNSAMGRWAPWMGSGDLRVTFFASRPLRGPRFSSSHTMAPVGQRSVGTCVALLFRE